MEFAIVWLLHGSDKECGHTPIEFRLVYSLVRAFPDYCDGNYCTFCPSPVEKTVPTDWFREEKLNHNRKGLANLAFLNSLVTAHVCYFIWITLFIEVGFSFP